MAVITNSESSTLISGTNNNDSISNTGENVTINGGAGNDKIVNDRQMVWIDKANSTETFKPDNSTLDGGEGNDYIFNVGSNVLIFGGADNDSIDNIYMDVWNSKTEKWEYITPNDVTIAGGTGDDTINLNSYYRKKTLIQYTEGEGNDIIYGFHANSTLSIGGDSYSTKKKRCRYYRHGRRREDNISWRG